jgi:hypothetical protein
MTLKGYSLRLSSSQGDPIDFDLARRALALSYGRTVNDVGSLSLTLPGDYAFPIAALPDGKLEAWRRLPNGREYLDTDTIWLVQAIEYREDERGNRTLEVEADTPLCLLREPGRFVDAYAGSGGAEDAGAADDVIKDIVREQIGSSAVAARQIPGFSVAADTSQAPSISKAFAWRAVLDVLQDIAAASAEQGVYLAFDIVSPTPDTLQFQTFTVARGVDNRFPSGLAPVVLSPERRNLVQPSLRYDFRDEVTYAKAGGSGENTARLTGEAIDTARAGASPYRRREKFINASNTVGAGALTDEAAGAVRAGRPRVIISGKIAETAGFQYGVHWRWGDYVTIQAFGRQVDARIDAITVEVGPGGETISAVVRGEQYV